MASRHYNRAKEYSATTLLAQSKMEAMVVTPEASLAPSSGMFSAPFDGYTCQVALIDQDQDRKVVKVTVTSPAGSWPGGMADASDMRSLACASIIPPPTPGLPAQACRCRGFLIRQGESPPGQFGRQVLY